ncbi:hypothetical protein HO133_005337 [Letharia lupina]|uniref:Uncharacterized protein n=1 Tax=Letharia lupina TaxID=560253 RepID=A0A8H6F8R3_9LECA|nr:uncharacterized protein HO133_005337 [Letharia lupina]KAF6218794.1 hypothetical protein HO133_005337 [Letharia lupina]
MGPTIYKTPASNKAPARRAHKTRPDNVSSSPSFSPPKNVVQPVQKTIQRETTVGSTPANDWISAIGLDKSDLRRASISSFPPPHRYPKPSQPKNPTPTRIMTSINGVPMYSHGTSATPLAPHKILLPKLDPTLRSAAPVFSPSSSRSVAPPAQQQQPQQQHTPADDTFRTPPPFDPKKCHWRALRDVAFVLDGRVVLSSEDLCALLRFRYARTDPLMAGVELGHVGAMYGFCKGWPRELYEEKAENLIRVQMGMDLKLMREGGLGVVSEDF